MKLAILGTRGIPAQHGGFETFAEHLACYLVKRGWDVSVYCPAYSASKIEFVFWQGIRLVNIPTRRTDALGTVFFDWDSTRYASKEGGVVLNLGYGTAIFSFLYRLHSVHNLINMDGIEWRREKWSFVQKSWLYLNERAACLLANHLIADHPEIKRHLTSRVSADKITMIPYGADAVLDADQNIVTHYGLTVKGYALLIARPDPDNSILEIVEAFSRRQRGVKLVVLGHYFPSTDAYHRAVINAASDEVVFLGGLYDKNVVEALRFFARLYIHGHKVGGTNPSLVESLAAGTPILAHDNPFNRWVAGEGAAYFSSSDDCEARLELLLGNENKLAQMRLASRLRHVQAFTWETVLADYETLLASWGL